MSRSSFHLSFHDRLLLPAALLIAVLQSGCEKEPVPLTTNSVIYGMVQAGYEGGGIKVTAFGPYGSKSTVTDENDNFSIDSLGNGTYYLEYMKEGFGTMRQYSIQVFGNDTVRAYITQLYRLPELLAPPTLVRAYTGVRPRSYPEKTWIAIDTDFRQENINEKIYQMVLFFSDRKDVAWNISKQSGFFYDIQFNNQLMTLYVDIPRLSFKSGTKVYVIAYPCNNQENSPYLDTYLGRLIYSTLDKNHPSNVVSFTMPLQ